VKSDQITDDRITAFLFSCVHLEYVRGDAIIAIVIILSLFYV